MSEFTHETIVLLQKCCINPAVLTVRLQCCKIIDMINWSVVIWDDHVLAQIAAAMHSGCNHFFFISIVSAFSVVDLLRHAVLSAAWNSGHFLSSSELKSMKLNLTISSLFVCLRRLGDLRVHNDVHSSFNVFRTSATRWGLKSLHFHAADVICWKVPLKSIFPKEWRAGPNSRLLVWLGQATSTEAFVSELEGLHGSLTLKRSALVVASSSPLRICWKVDPSPSASSHWGRSPAEFSKVVLTT